MGVKVGETNLYHSHSLVFVTDILFDVFSAEHIIWQYSFYLDKKVLFNLSEKEIKPFEKGWRSSLCPISVLVI